MNYFTLLDLAQKALGYGVGDKFNSLCILEEKKKSITILAFKTAQGLQCSQN